MVKKAIVFDNSGTLIERYRAIKDIKKDKIFTNISSQDIVMGSKTYAMVVLQFNSADLLKIDSNYLISDFIKENNIDFDLSFSTYEVSKEIIKRIIENDKKAIVADISETFKPLKEKIGKIELCVGSALIIDIEKAEIVYTITSAGRFFKRSISTVKTLNNYGFEIFLASGDRSSIISKITKILNIPENHGYPTSSTLKKAEIVKELQNKGFHVTMVGDGINDLKAFEASDKSILTLEQEDEVSSLVIGKTDYIIYEISEIIEILCSD